MDNKQYETSERIKFCRQLRDVESAPLQDRKEARESWREALTDSKNIADRASWLLDGSYGYGSYIMAREVVVNKRMNRVAWLSITLAALEYGCPSAFARQEYLKLDKAQQEKINAAIDAVLSDAYDAIRAE